MQAKCPIEYTVSLINGKWKVAILKELSQGAVRYGELGRALPEISQKVLTSQLRELESDGLIRRQVYAEVPPRVDYTLTERGLSLFTIFVELRRWGMEQSRTSEVECIYCGKCQPFIQDNPTARDIKANKLA